MAETEEAPVKPLEPGPEVSAKGNDGRTCGRCGVAFPSKNQLFKHLKDAAGACGAACEAEGGVGDGPSARERKLLRLTIVTAGASASKAAALRQRWRYTHDLWLGDIPPEHATLKRIRQLLWTTGEVGSPQPYVRKLVRKGYRQGTVLEDGSRPWLGYAFLSYRCAEEASAALLELQGKEAAAGFVLRLRPAEPEEGGGGERGAKPFGLAPGEDPPLAQQLAPLSRSELQRRLVEGGREEGVREMKDDALLRACCLLYAEEPRAERHVQGAPVPAGLLAPLLAELEAVKWPANSHRYKVTAEQYLVLKRDEEHCPEYAGLKRAAAAVLQSTDPAFPWDNLAVTKNFVGSPHIDWRDVSHQYALSLGAFGAGGELCVDAGDEGAGGGVMVVDTRGKVASVDGRFVHWVRGYGLEEGDRYSLIYYVCREQNATPRGLPFLGTFRGCAPPEGA